VAAGDSAHYRGDLQHCIENSGEQELLCYLVVTSTTLPLRHSPTAVRVPDKLGRFNWITSE
jgi:hypothetical protein